MAIDFDNLTIGIAPKWRFAVRAGKINYCAPKVESRATK